MIGISQFAIEMVKLSAIPKLPNTPCQSWWLAGSCDCLTEKRQYFAASKTDLLLLKRQMTRNRNNKTQN